MLKRADLVKRIEEFGLNSGAVGDLITVGSQHYVMRYQDDKVIKLPRKSFRTHVTGRYTPSLVRNHINIINRHLRDYTVKTEVISDSKDREYVILQEFIKGGRYLSSSNIESVVKQFAQLLLLNETIMREEKKCIDFFGLHGIVTSLGNGALGRSPNWIMSNIMLRVEDSMPKIFLVDTNLSLIAADPKNTRLRAFADKIMSNLSMNLIKSRIGSF